jgi:hypothetical protein
MDNKKFKIASKQISTANLFIINSFIEVVVPEGSTTSIAKDLVFLEFYQGYNRNTKLSMMMDCFELRRLSYGLKELYKIGKSSYKNFTDPKLSNNTNSSGRKELSLGLIDNKYFVNLRHENADTYKITLDKYSLLAFCDSIDLIAETTETKLYSYQMKLAVSCTKLDLT